MADTKQNETPRLIAERLAAEHIGTAAYYAEQRRLCANAIEAALNAERERCAEIAQSDDFTHSSGYRCHRGEFIAKKIRGKD